MTYDDVPAVESLTARVFHELATRTRPANWPPAELRPEERAVRSRERLRHFASHDPAGCWVSEEDGAVVGSAVALLREGMWGLSSFAVAPERQARGIGRALLKAALAHGPWDAAMVCSTNDPRAVRRYRLAGFDIHPAMLMWGHVRRASVPALPDVRSGTPTDVELLDRVDRASRGYGRRVDHELLVQQYPLVVVEHGASRGYAYLLANGSPYLLAATDAEAARRTLWAALAHSTPDVPVDFGNITSGQSWAIDLGMSAGLELHNHGYVAVQGMAPPWPYLTAGPFL